MNPIKTLFLIGTLDPAPAVPGRTAGGAERLTRDICLSIDKNRISPVVLTQFSPGAVGAELDGAGIPWFVREKKSRIPFAYWAFLRKLIMREKIDAVISMNQGPNLHNVIVTPTIRGVGCVMSVAGVSLPNRIYQTEGRLSKRAHILIFPSEYSKKSNSSRYSITEEHKRVIPNGCNTSQFGYVPFERRIETRKRLELPEDSFILYTPSRIHYKKGQDVMAEAMSMIPDALLSRKVLWLNTGLVQDEEVASRMRHFAAKVPAHINFSPPVSNSADYIAAADAVAIPSRDESFSLVALEAASVGRVFLGTDCGEIPAIAKGTGSIVVAKNSAKSLSEGILRLLSIPGEELAMLGENAAKFVREHYSIESAAEKYADVIEEAVAIAGRRKGSDARI